MQVEFDMDQPIESENVTHAESDVIFFPNPLKKEWWDRRDNPLIRKKKPNPIPMTNASYAKEREIQVA